ncbi:hypothetical protein [Microbacterium oxydans]|uniref:hypothetical protein n=1 Tax=Microbacterium oxydans TaxID=82380 RepID=UPI0012DFED4F|nr:hypothetical protein [Microbacterium oxydans]
MIALASVAGVVLVLAGCETAYQYGPYALGTDGENLSVASGEIVVVGGDNPGPVNRVGLKSTAEPGVRYFLDMNEALGQVTSALFRVPEGGLSPGEWLTPEGDVSSEPCSRPDTT